jgi:Berberine and berberine like
MPAVPAAPATTILMPGDPGWDDARQAWSLSVDQHPAAGALPASAQEVVDVVRFAGQMYLNLAETRRRPSSFWTPEACGRLRQIKTAVDPDDMIRSNHPVPPHHEGTLS